MYAIFVTVKIKPECRAQFLSAIEEDALSSERDEPGCLRFNVLQNREDENTYYFFEVYRDEAAFQAHRETPHLARWAAAAKEVLVAPSSRIDLTPVIPREQAYWG